MRYDITGNRYGKLLVTKYHGMDKFGKNSRWLCFCDCGNKTIVNRPGLIQGGTRSCGCINSPPKEEYEKERTKRFFDYVNKTQTCWIWMGVKDKEGYGMFSFRKRKIKSHRFSFQLINGKIPTGYMLCHTCDNPSCVNPDHLYVGTAKDNAKDCVDRKRYGKKAIRLEEKVIKACKILLKSEMSQREISEVLNISLNTVKYYENH